MSQPDTHPASRLVTASGIHLLDVCLADSFWRRFRGLMFAPPLAPSAGLLLTRCSSVHCAFMRQTIDVVYLDRAGTVLKCVEHLKPWRASASNAGRDAHGRRHPRAAHTLELAAGTIARLGIRPGDRLEHPALQAQAKVVPLRAQAQRGAAMVEFVVVGPLMTLVGLGVLQYGMIFQAKNALNHASFIAARAGSMGNANVDTVKTAYKKALIPVYGGGTDAQEVAEAWDKVQADDAEGLFKVYLLNPTKESFDDHNDAALQAKYNTGSKRVIRNSGLAFRDNTSVGPTSGQTKYDANLLKLRIVHAYQPKVPVVRSIYSAYLKAADPKTDAIYTAMVQANRIPVVTNITMHMQSDAIEGTPISTPGQGNNGTPTNPGDPPVSTNPPPTCNGIGCSTPDPVDPGTPCTGSDCPVCPAG